MDIAQICVALLAVGFLIFLFTAVRDNRKTQEAKLHKEQEELADANSLIYGFGIAIRSWVNKDCPEDNMWQFQTKYGLCHNFNVYLELMAIEHPVWGIAKHKLSQRLERYNPKSPYYPFKEVDDVGMWTASQERLLYQSPERLAYINDHSNWS